VKPSTTTIITCAVTGAIHTPSMSDALPITADEIVSQAVDAHRAGAAILHIHVRRPEDGYPSGDVELYRPVIQALRDETNAVLNITTGGSTQMSLDERLAAAKHFRPEIASLNMGTMNFDYSAAANRVTHWKYEWEKAYLENSRRVPFVNTLENIEGILRELGSLGTRFEFECYDVGHLYTLAHFVEIGLANAPLLVQAVFGIRGGIGADHENLTHMQLIADKLFGDDYVFSAFAAGRNQLSFGLHSAMVGGHVRVGLEDGLFLGPGELAKSNAAQVERARALLEGLGKQVATVDEARALLGLGGLEGLAAR